MTKLLLMFLEFFKTGLFAVGGGLATIPFLREIGVRYGWSAQKTAHSQKIRKTKRKTDRDGRSVP